MAVDVLLVESVYQPCSIIFFTLTADIIYLTKFIGRQVQRSSVAHCSFFQR